MSVTPWSAAVRRTRRAVAAVAVAAVVASPLVLAQASSAEALTDRAASEPAAYGPAAIEPAAYGQAAGGRAAYGKAVDGPAGYGQAAAGGQAVPAQDWLHVQGNKIVDDAGKEVWLTGANWFGFNAGERVFHGLWSGNLEQITRSMAERGINLVRVPISTQLLLEWSRGQTIIPNVNTNANPDLVGLNNLQVFDRFLALCEKYGLKMFLDVHSAEADNSGHLYPLWYKGSITTENAYQAWEWVTTRYRTNDTMIGADLKNEPHGQFSETAFAKWDDSTDPTNFKHFAETAARRILAINPHLLIFVEGTEVYPKDGVSWTSKNKDDWYNNWWGGQLRGVAQHPIDLGANQDQLVYSPHDYGPLVFEQPWFTGTWDRTTLERDVWDPNWLYIDKQGLAPLLIGEWGGFLDGGRNEKWMVALRNLIVERRLHQTFWVLNPNSGDTGGLLLNDWASWDEAKYALLRPALWAQGGKFVSLDHQVRLGGPASTTGISLTEATGGDPTPTDTTAPSVPTGLRAGTATTTSIPLTWTASTDNSGGSGVAGYDVYRGTTLLGTTAIPSYTASGLTPATAYTFTVRARDVAGNLSAASAAVTASTTTGPATGACAVQYTTNDWSNGFTGTVRLTNTGTTAWAGWILGFAFPGSQTVLQGWSATWSQTGSAVTARSLDWNASLAAGATVEVGFNGSFTGSNPRPTAFTVNGAACTVR